jgi:hypothetical protein
MAKNWTIVGKDLLSVVSCTEPYEWKDPTDAEWEFNNATKEQQKKFLVGGLHPSTCGDAGEHPPACMASNSPQRVEGCGCQRGAPMPQGQCCFVCFGRPTLLAPNLQTPDVCKHTAAGGGL